MSQPNPLAPRILIPLLFLSGFGLRDGDFLGRSSNDGDLDRIFQREDVTIAVTDSGLGGLSVMAEAVRRMREERVFRKANFIFFNALFSLEGGYNTLKTRQEKIGIFTYALESLKENFHPDVILIGCNTLSVLYPDTPFAQKTSAPVIGIVETGVYMIAESLRAHPEARVILFATPTTVSEATHKKMLTAQGYGGDLILLQSCPELENYIERDYAGDETEMLIAACVDEALQKIPFPQPFFASLNCTHYGYSLPLWEKAFEEAGAKPLAILNPNSQMVDVLFPFEYRHRFQKTAISARVVSMVEIAPEKRSTLGKWLEGISPEVAASLRGYELYPSLFEWRKSAS